MPMQVADRVKETTTTTGTGPLTLAGAVQGFRAFSAICAVGDTVYYALQVLDASGNPNDWETGVGTYSAAATLTRTTVLASSNAGALVNLGAGTKQVWLDLVAKGIVQILPDGNVVIGGGTDDGNLLQVNGVIESKSGGYTFPDGTTQTTANGVTAPASQTYVQGATDAVGTFALGDTRLRTSGFSSPFVEVKRGGLWLTRGKHYTLDADGVHLDGFDPFNVDDTDVEVLTRVIYSPATAYSPAFAPLSIGGGATFIPYAHVQGFAPLMNGGQWLTPGTDYTEDATGYYLQGFSTAVNDSWAAWNLTPITLANMLSKVNPTIGSGPLTFADGSQQSSVLASNRNLLVDGRHDSAPVGSTALTVGGAYSQSPMWVASAGTSGAGTSAVNDIRAIPPALFDSSPRNVVGLQIGTASTGTFAGRTLPLLYQRVEGVHTAAGKSVTLSFKLWANTGTITVPGLIIAQNFGTGGSPTPTVVLDKAVNWVVTTSPQRFSVRIDFPALPNGFVLGSNNNDVVNFGLYFPPGVVNTLWMTEAQCELCSPQSPSDLNGNGGSPTVYEFRGMQAEIARVQRYYTTIALPALISNGYSSYGGAFQTGYEKVSMRANPAASLVGSLVGNATGGVSVLAYTDSVSWSFTTTVAGGLYYNAANYTLDARL